MNKIDNYEKALKYALWIMGRRNHSEKEIRKKLSRNYTDETVDKVIEKFKSENILNDESFAKEWAEFRFNQHKSKMFVAWELVGKGIHKDVIAGLIESSGIDDLENAYRTIERRIKMYKHLEPAKLKNKIYRYLASRGFSADIIQEVAERILGEK
ncbi:MAG: Regulatory protein RecX [Elusimicrobia bacterium ADurb.Bin231]|nr:MAG: Regulatory protein RecX [Elusimicrobia bacterium ADurb.Bin231]